MFLEICEKLGFPSEACCVLSKCCEELDGNPALQEWMAEAEESLLEPGSEKYLDLYQKISEESGIHRYIVDMVMLIKAVVPLKERYAQKDLPEQLLWDSITDLRYKMLECHAVYGIWGSFVTPWFKKFYLCELFQLGRLQYEKIVFDQPTFRDSVKTGDVVLSCHIPSSGALLMEDVMESFRLAHDFYKNDYPSGILPVFCHSWLMYPPHYEQVFPEDSNLHKFYELFEIINFAEQENNGDFWRVFHVPFSPEALEQAVGDTRLRRNFLRFLKAGNKMGNGRGMLLFDGQKIL